MSEKNAVAIQRMHQMLIKEYVKTHTGVRESEVIVRSVNGKAVCDTIAHLLASASKINAQQQIDPESYRKQMETSEEQRYKDCQISIQSSAKLCDYLIQSPYYPFTEEDKKKTEEYLERFIKICAQRTQTAKYIRKAFMQMMDGITVPTRSKIKSELSKFFHVILDQLKAQKAIFKRELDLGNGFCICILKQMEASMPKVQGKLSEKDWKNVEKAYKVLVIESQREEQSKTEDFNELKSIVNSMKGHLDRRHIQFQAIEKIVAFLEKMIERLDNPEPQASSAKDKKVKKSRRMAFFSKIFSSQ